MTDVECVIVDGPVNIVSLVNQSVSFNCSSTDTSLVLWDYMIENDTRIQWRNGGRFKFNETRCRTEQYCVLEIENVQMSDPGYTICYENGE